MPAGNQPPLLGESSTRAAPWNPPASAAALVPASAIAVHVTALWWGPSSPAFLRPLLPWPFEALLVWLPWGSACVWAARRAPRTHRSQRMSDGIVGATALACAVHYVLAFRLPAARGDWSSARLISELAASLSATAGGVPWRASAYVLGWTATTAVLARVLAGVAKEMGAGPRTEGGARVLALVIFVIGSSALLRYATGSPWPLLGNV